MIEITNLNMVNNTVIAVVLAAFCMVSLVITRSKTRIYALITNVLLVGLIAGIFSYQFNIEPKSHEEYDGYCSANGSFSTPMTYEGIQDGYYIVDHVIESYAIPVSDVKNTKLPRVGSNCTLYLDGSATVDNVSSKNLVDIGGKSCYVQSSVIAIIYNPSNLLATSLAVIVIVYVVNNLVVIVMTAMKKKKEKAKPTYNRDNRR